MIHIECFHILIVAKYLKTSNDFLNLEMVCKKYYNFTKNFHFNPISVSENNLVLFPNLETLHLYSPCDDFFPEKAFFQKIVHYKVIHSSLPNALPEHVTYSFVEYVVNGYYSKEIVSIPPLVTSISDGCFRGCFALSSVSLCSTVTRLGAACFYGCCNISNISIPHNVIFIGKDAFNWCSSLEQIVLPKFITKLEKTTFCGCSKLSEVELPQYLINIGGVVFFWV
ncbi:hypothetical protein EIN_127170 [Entamoeba invadens IP1]|uniref:Leucine rich repeat containing protein BspA family protein n=1 Tax=Entamoeba invadens IP1 TaxID=370355 RepID=L7FP03_ENTIV|nr:hypothetical protein EIN_127170 [Entamoeba invadens IP1]ELP89529.1 hypothetical protein EIN_127170 [Entamoeba invadens IP1]|eukprot:XP_004256300.1 hypothetical protein EIN_127170 [Entamoeba invadens IP1]